jgi:hypothetical protein
VQCTSGCTLSGPPLVCGPSQTVYTVTCE